MRWAIERAVGSVYSILWEIKKKGTHLDFEEILRGTVDFLEGLLSRLRDSLHCEWGRDRDR
jgi:hypothetical protein